MGKKEVVLLTGASGSMGFETFKQLWEKRDRYDIVLLLRPSKKNRKKFREFEQKAGKSGETHLKIIWGDILNRGDVAEACRGIDWCLHTMALIPPAADRDPEMAHKVNALGTQYLVEAIEAEDPENIRLVNIATIAEYGDRRPPVQMARAGDPVVPSVYDHYALSKVKGELAVMQSRIRHRVSLRQTFILIPDLFSLMDPILFHQPINSYIESITARDSGRLMLSCLEVPGHSDFWDGFYNISGGPACRTTFLEFLDEIYKLLGIRLRKVMKRPWFALKNFHMHFIEDSNRLNAYLNHWEGGQTLDEYYLEVWKAFPWYLKVTAWFNRYLPPFRAFVEAMTRIRLKKLAHEKDGILGWLDRNDTGRINAFYGSLEAYHNIPGWDEDMPSLDHAQPYRRLDHGYDESREELELKDLQQAAIFRGGELVSGEWSGDMNQSLSWICCQDHPFKMSPQAVLKGGHWCLECISPPWNHHLVADKNHFAAQILLRTS